MPESVVAVSCPRCKRNLAEIDLAHVTVRVPLYHRCAEIVYMPSKLPFVVKFGPRMEGAPV